MGNGEAQYLSFWGKARHEEGCALPGGPHPAAFHMLDVAAVAEAWLAANDPFIPGIGANARAFWPAIVALVALHDIGKFSLPFQARRPDLWPPVLGPIRRLSTPRHDTAGYGLLQTRAFAARLNRVCPDTDRNYLLRAVCGHHGRPPFDTALDSEAFNQAARDAAAAFTAELLDLLDPAPLPEMSEDGVTAFSWWLAGLTVLADWIGSNDERWFHYPCDADSIRDYWPRARAAARRAVAEAGLCRIAPNAALSLPRLLSGHAPTPAQEFVAAVELGPPGAPALVIIEDQTGSGKTEAALILAHRLMVEKNARGLFIALPTMATADALYERLAKTYADLFEAGAEPSLVLAHGKRHLNDRFAAAMRRGAAPPEPVDEDADETASAQCAAWIGQDRRRAFLADCGVGTIDQALHGVLPTRHAPLRLFGLCQRVLVIDEAHAYDAYMQQELFWLVQFQARLGGSIVMLSATLPMLDRRKLVEVFNQEAGFANPALECGDYPLVTVASGDGVVEHPVAPLPGLARNMAVHRLADQEEAVEIVAAAQARGAAVGWIRNTVDDAVAAQAALQARGIDAILFHARFAMGDRLAIQQVIQDSFGKSSAGAARARVVVGTQVMEQSLDIDFDVMVSDIAPVDLLLQRAGRLWRHPWRQRNEAAPLLFVIAPDPVADPPADWLKGFGGTGAVYRDHGVLWRSARAIFAQACIAIPADVRRLVEQVYGADAAVPDGLAENSGKAAGVAGAARAVAWQNLLTFKDGYAQGSGAWASDVSTPTRLAEPGQTCRIGIWRDGRIDPCCEHPEKSWAMSEITLPFRRVAGVPPETGARGAAVQALRKGWGRWEQEIPVLLLDAEGHGTVTDRESQPLAVRYTHDGGLVFAA